MSDLKSEHWSGPYAAAKALSMSRTTLECRVSGGKSRTEVCEIQQKLTKGLGEMDYTLDSHRTSCSTWFYSGYGRGN